MSDETPPEPGERRTFSDVVSLFQPIVPPAGTPVRPVPAAPMPPPAALSAEWAAPRPAPPRPPDPAIGPPPPVPAPPSADEPAGSVATEPAFAHAWEARPNWQRPRSWTWVLLVPLGLLGAGLILVLDPAQLRHWFNEHVWAPPPQPLPPLLASRASPAPAPPPEPVPPPTTTPAAPQPMQAGPGPAPAEPPAAPAPPEPSATPPAAETAAAAPEATPPRAEPAPTAGSAPVPTPTLSASSPPPAAPAPVPAPTSPPAAPARPAAPVFGSVVIRYRQSQPSAETEAARLAAQVQPLAERVDMRVMTQVYRTPTILFFRPEDRDAAEGLAQVITATGGRWTVRQGQGRQRPGALEVWLP